MAADTHANGNLVRLHEKRMDDISEWCKVLEKKVDKIPWVLLAVIFNIFLSILGVVLKMGVK